MSHSPTTGIWHMPYTAQPSLKTGVAAFIVSSKPVRSKESKNPHGAGTEHSSTSPSDTQKEQSGGLVTQNVAQNVAQNLDEHIIRIIKSNPCIKRDDIANQLSVNKKTIERHLKVLGIKWEGHPKTGHWNVVLSNNVNKD